uniref:Uncharacterized protein n=1 Tax=Chrysemys picta bellii TaxID=8478 RepID=A0A8C3HNF3_CHRPI
VGLPPPTGVPALQERVAVLQTESHVLWSQVAQLLAENQTLCEQQAWSQEEKSILQSQVGAQPSKQGPVVPEFLNQCSLLFLFHHQMYPIAQARVGLAISLLAGEVLDRASPLLEKDTLVLTDWNAFLQNIVGEKRGWGTILGPSPQRI